ncbi:MAG: hypothetical protein EBU84_10905 [Actinobacteria bacterium]|nr:hypothetical protein [Actinomycetota bacterium]
MSTLEFEEVEIDEVVFSDTAEEYVDIEVANDHTFFVSTAGKSFALTHNTSWPDIDSDAADRDVLIEEARNLFGVDATRRSDAAGT